MVDDAELTDELLLTDEAAQACSRDDEANINDAKRKAPGARSSRAAFAQRYSVKKRELRGDDKGSGKGGARGRGRGRGAGSGVPRRVLPAASAMDEMTHEEAKALMPPDSFLWKSRGHGGCWKSEVRPSGECSRSVQKHGFGQALWVVVSFAWRKHCLEEAIPLADCPMQNLAPEDA